MEVELIFILKIKKFSKNWSKCYSRRKLDSFRIMEEKKKFKLVSSKKTRYLTYQIFLTLGGVCLGISSIKFSIDGNYNLAVIFILLAAILML